MRTLLAFAILTACSDPATTIVMSASDDVPAYGTTPFPTDALRDGDRLGTLTGLETLVERNAHVVASHLTGLDGFGGGARAVSSGDDRVLSFRGRFLRSSPRMIHASRPSRRA